MGRRMFFSVFSDSLSSYLSVPPRSCSLVCKLAKLSLIDRIAIVTVRTSLTSSLVSAVVSLVWCRPLHPLLSLDPKIRIYDIGCKSASVDAFPFVAHMLSDEKEQVWSCLWRTICSFPLKLWKPPVLPATST